MKTALVAIVIGDAYRRIYDRYIRARFEAYAARCGYELRVIDRPIRNLPGKQFTWQKLCLHDMPWFADYEQMAFIDSDIFITRDAPPLPDIVPGRVALVPDKGQPFQYNSGVLLFKPGPDIADVFEESLKDPDYKWDQKSLTRVLQARGMDAPLDRRFNRLVYLRDCSLAGTLLGRHWFYHALCGKSKLTLVSALLKMQGR